MWKSFWRRRPFHWTLRLCMSWFHLALVIALLRACGELRNHVHTAGAQCGTKLLNRGLNHGLRIVVASDLAGDFGYQPFTVGPGRCFLKEPCIFSRQGHTFRNRPNEIELIL